MPIRSVRWSGPSVRSSVLILALATLAMTAPASAADGRNGVSARVELPAKTMAAGTTMEATVIVRNRTGKALTVDGCGSLFQVALRSQTYEPVVGWNLCRQAITVPQGRSRYGVTVTAAPLVCSGDGGGGVPLCVDGNGNPPTLPPGKYQATLYQNPKVVAHLTSVPVRVTR